VTTAIPPLSYEHTASVLKKLANLEHQIVLVGGPIDQLASDPFETLKCNEEFFDIAQYRAGVEVFTRYQIDVLEALVDAPGLPEKFYSERLPRARAAVERARAKGFAAMARAKASAERHRS
jgi:hypothetical protein